MEPKRSNHFLAHLPTILLLVLFAMSPWLGILFFILRAIDRDAEKKEQTNADPARDSHAKDARTAQSAASGQRSETVSDPDVPTAEQKSAKQWHKTLTTLCTIFGAIFLLVGIGDLADAMEELWSHEIDWDELLTALAQTIGGGAALFTGLRMDRARKLERKLDKIVGDRDNIALGELFAAVGIDAVRGRAAVEHAIDHGYFGADAYIDYRTDTLIVRGAAPPAAQGSAAGAGSGTGRPVRLPSAAAAPRQRCHPRPGDDGQDLPAGRAQRPHLCSGQERPG